MVICLGTKLYPTVYKTLMWTHLTFVLQRHKASQITESHYDPVRTCRPRRHRYSWLLIINCIDCFIIHAFTRYTFIGLMFEQLFLIVLLLVFVFVVAFVRYACVCFTEVFKRQSTQRAAVLQLWKRCMFIIYLYINSHCQYRNKESLNKNNNKKPLTALPPRSAVALTQQHTPTHHI